MLGASSFDVVCLLVCDTVLLGLTVSSAVLATVAGSLAVMRLNGIALRLGVIAMLRLGVIATLRLSKMTTLRLSKSGQATTLGLFDTSTSFMEFGRARVTSSKALAEARTSERSSNAEAGATETKSKTFSTTDGTKSTTKAATDATTNVKAKT